MIIQSSSALRKQYYLHRSPSSKTTGFNIHYYADWYQSHTLINKQQDVPSAIKVMLKSPPTWKTESSTHWWQYKHLVECLELLLFCPWTQNHISCWHLTAFCEQKMVIWASPLQVTGLFIEQDVEMGGYYSSFMFFGFIPFKLTIRIITILFLFGQLLYSYEAAFYNKPYLERI